MSLINQMLKDLEQRRAHPGAARPEVQLEVQAVAEAEAEPRIWRRIVVLGGLLVVISGFGWWGYRTLLPVPAVSLAEAPVVRQTSGIAAVAQVVPVAQVAAKPQNRVVQRAKAVVAVEVAKATIAPPVVEAVTKVDRPLSPQELAAAAFQRGLAAQRSGQRTVMEMELHQALAHDPFHLLARETLAASLHRSGRLEEAKQVLRGGITETSAPLPLRKSLARILVDQDAPEEAALALLQGGSPPVAQDTEFHQLLGAIYQRTGQYSAAALTYRQLLTVKRETGVWWVGLGLALESSRALPEAKQAYRNALQDPIMPSGLGDFARGRVVALTAEGVN